MDFGTPMRHLGEVEQGTWLNGIEGENGGGPGEVEGGRKYHQRTTRILPVLYFPSLGNISNKIQLY